MMTRADKQFLKYAKLAEGVEKLSQELSHVKDEDLLEITQGLKEEFLNSKDKELVMQKAFGLACDAIYRVYGVRLNKMQIIGGLAMADGNAVEMKTGEGKTWTAVLPSFYYSLSGSPVHVMTANDYLAQRDAEEVEPILKLLGVDVSFIDSNSSKDEKKTAYGADIVYGTTANFGFDFLRDNLVKDKNDKVMRGLGVAIIDEADSLLLDQAQTPLIISNLITASQDEKSMLENATFFAQNILEKKDVEIDLKARIATLDDSGAKKAEEYFGFDFDNLDLEYLYFINNAISARFMFHRDVDYIVSGGRVVLIDKNTARTLPLHRFEEGIQMALESKEDLQITPQTKTIAKITIQNFINQYKNIAGMSGTIKHCEDELKHIYGLDVIEIPTNKKVVRVDEKTQIFSRISEKYDKIIENIENSHKNGQPVLVGVTGIEESQIISDMLNAVGIEHSVLSAKNHKQEAEIIAKAGRFGAVTIATDMAGRGTDIKLGGDVKMIMSHLPKTNRSDRIKSIESFFEKEVSKNREKVLGVGGLKVIGTSVHRLERLDDQLKGRAGRQGDVGESIFYFSLEDDFSKYALNTNWEYRQAVINYLNNPTKVVEDEVISMLKNVQKTNESIDYESRKSLVAYNEQLNKEYIEFYKLRDDVLNRENFDAIVLSSINTLINDVIDAKTNSAKSKIFSKDYQVIYDKFIGQDLKFNAKNREYLTSEICGKIESVLDRSVLEKNAKSMLLDAMDGEFVYYLAEIDFLMSSISQISAKDKMLETFNKMTHEKYDEMITKIKSRFALSVIKNNPEVLLSKTEDFEINNTKI